MNEQVQADVQHVMRQASADATLIDRLHTAEARVAILESQVASAAADIDDAVDRFKRLGEQLALQGAELFALRQFKAGVPWDDLYTCIVIAANSDAAGDDRQAIVRAASWHDLNEPKEAL